MPVKALPIPLKDMTPEQKRQYNNAAVQRSRERKKSGEVKPTRERELRSEALGTLIAAGALPETLGKKNIYLSVELGIALDNTITALKGAPLYLDQTDFFEAATRNYISALEELYNDGKPFPPAPARTKAWAKAKPRKRGRPPVKGKAKKAAARK